MKRTWRAILALTLVCAVALTAAAMALGSKALPLTMTDACTIGDPAAAEGLHMAARIGMEQNRLQWRMDYDPAADTTDASFRLAYSDRSGQWIFDGYGYNIQCLLVNQEDDSDPICREVLRQARASGEETVDVTVHLADYWQDLPLSLSGALWSGGGDFCDVYGPWDVGDTVPFPALSIPVRESDHLTVALARNADGSYEINGYDFTGISSAMYFTPFSLPLEGGTLTTLGIDPAAQPQPDWAPEGYGLWYVPVQTDDDGSSTPVPSRRQLVYPLDITRQQVVTLKQEKLGGTAPMVEQTGIIGVTEGIYNDMIAYSKNSDLMADEDFRKALGEAFIEIAQTDEGKEIISVFSQVGYTWGKDSDYDGERDAQAMLKSAGK